MAKRLIFKPKKLKEVTEEDQIEEVTESLLKVNIEKTQEGYEKGN